MFSTLQDFHVKPKAGFQGFVFLEASRAAFKASEQQKRNRSPKRAIVILETLKL
jgi:hypothetical protein